MRHVLFRTALIAGACVSAATPAAEPVGRLFFTPAQRSALDAGKRIGEPRTAPVAPRGPRELTLDGVVTRSDGESTVWVNGRALGKRTTPGISAMASGSDPAAARVNISGARETVQLRVGQRLERDTGKIAEPYEPIVGRTQTVTPVAKESKPATRRQQASSNPEALTEQASDD